MANTNMNTGSGIPSAALSTDIYEISEFIDTIRQQSVPDVSETSSIVGMFGYMNEIFSQTLQNTLIVMSETSNEVIPTKAKYSKNIISHALNLGIRKINAQPAVMTVMIYLPTDYIEMNFTEVNNVSGRAKFILDKNVPIYLGDFEFHLDYDVIITRIKNPNGEYVYSAMYDLFDTGTTNVKQNNPLSDIRNPYINTLVKSKLKGIDCLAFSARIRQVRRSYIPKNILTSSTIENKTITFTFEDQMASFDIDVTDGNNIIHLTPIYSGLLDYTVEDGEWCYYEYIDEHTIRIIFSKDSYVPPMNATVTVNLQLSDGAAGNIIYNKNVRQGMNSEKYNNYNGMYMEIYPLMDGVATKGKDRKSIKELKRIIPREASSRGSVINTTDLQNFFNSIDDENCRIYFKKKRDNPLERLYYAYILMRKEACVYPTNTLHLRLEQSDFNGNSKNNNLSINPGTVFYYYDHGDDVENDYATLYPPVYVDELEESKYHMTINSNMDKVRVFEYISPFLITIDSDLVSSYLLTTMNDNKAFTFESINTNSDLQFVATNMNWKRRFLYEDENGEEQRYDNRYVMTIDMTQNSMSEYGLVKSHVDANGDTIFDDVRVKIYMVFYTDETDLHPYRYIEGVLDEYDDKNYIYTFKFYMETDDLMDLNNRINIKGIKNAKPEEFQKNTVIPNAHGYMNNNTFARLYILADFGTKPGDIIDNTKITEETAKVVLYGEDGIGNRTILESVLPTREDIITEFLKNNIYLERDGKNYNVVTIIKRNPEYLKVVKSYNNDDQESEAAILRYLRNNRDSDFVNDILLNDNDVQNVIDSYNYEDLDRYTLCNVMSVDGGINFYYDYSNMMRSNITVEHIRELDEDGNPLFKEINRVDSFGNSYKEMLPIYKTNESGGYYYQYTIKRIPMIKNGFLSTEEKMEDFVYDLEERRGYMNECLYVLEDTFDVDLKFFNTYGPSRMFYYNIPSATTYTVKVVVQYTNIYSNTADEDDKNEVVGKLLYNDEVKILKVKGQWGYINYPVEGWIKLTNTQKCIDYINNVALTMKFSLEAQTSADKTISNYIKRDVKEYIEDINEINELHIPNIITLITNSYREQLVYFEFFDVNDYGAACQHLYLEDNIEADKCPEFLNIETDDDGNPSIQITVY